jgi:hypothetical protein
MGIKYDDPTALRESAPLRVLLEEIRNEVVLFDACRAQE